MARIGSEPDLKKCQRCRTTTVLVDKLIEARDGIRLLLAGASLGPHLPSIDELSIAPISKSCAGSEKQVCSLCCPSSECLGQATGLYKVQSARCLTTLDHRSAENRVVQLEVFAPDELGAE